MFTKNFFATDNRGDLAFFGDIFLHGITSRATSLRIRSTKNDPIRSIFGLRAPVHVWGRSAPHASPLPPPTASPHCQRNPRSRRGSPLPDPLPTFTVGAPTVSPTANFYSGSPHCEPTANLGQARARVGGLMLATWLHALVLFGGRLLESDPTDPSHKSHLFYPYERNGCTLPWINWCII